MKLFVLVSLFAFLLLVSIVNAEPYKYAVARLDANFYNIPGCGERQSMLSSRTADYLFGELKEPLNWTGRRTQKLLDGEPVEQFTNAYGGNIGIDDMIMKSGQGHVRNITMPRDGSVNLVILRHDSPMWGSGGFVKYHNITISGKSSFKYGYDTGLSFPFLFPLNNFSIPLPVSEGEQLNITILGLDSGTIDPDRVNCIAEDYFSRDVFVFYIDNSSTPSINSFGDLNTGHFIPSVVFGNVNTSLGVWYAELEDEAGNRQNLTLEGQYPWEKNLSGILDADLNGSFNFTKRVCEEYGDCYEEKFVRNVFPAPDAVEGQVICTPKNVSIGDPFTCRKNVTNRGSAPAVDYNASFYLHSTPIFLGSKLINLSEGETREVEITISNWSVELKKEIGYHAIEGRIYNATIEYDGNNNYLSSWDAFRIMLSKFSVGGLKDFIINISFTTDAGLRWTNQTSVMTIEYVEPELIEGESWGQLCGVYNLTALSERGLSPSYFKFKKFNSSSGEYYNITIDLPWVNSITKNLSSRQVCLNASQFSPVTIEFEPEPEPVVIVQQQQSSSSSSGGGSSGKLTVIIVANDIDYGLSSQAIEMRYSRNKYDVYRLDAYNYSLINELVGKNYHRLVHVEFLGGHIAFDGMGGVIKNIEIANRIYLTDPPKPARFYPGVYTVGKINIGFGRWYYRGWPYNTDFVVYAGHNREETARLYADGVQ